MNQSPGLGEQSRLVKRSPIEGAADAYRTDLATNAQRAFCERDALWVAFATVLERGVSLEQEHRVAYLRNAATELAAAPSDPTDSIVEQVRGFLRQIQHYTHESAVVEAICSAALAIADDAENASAFATATVIIDGCRHLAGQSKPRILGRALARQARIFRKLGDFEKARELYGAVSALADTITDDELRARAHLGAGAVARVRGNFPVAREEFQAVLAIEPTSVALHELHLHAHHGLLIAAAVAADFVAALRHGDVALKGALNGDHRVELLANVAGVCLLAGQYESALNSALRVLAEANNTRVRLSALGTVAVAAAHLGDDSTVDRAAAGAREAARYDRHAYEVADMLREVAHAYAVLGNADAGAPFAKQSEELARRGGFFEILHQLETTRVVARAPRARATLPQDVYVIAEDLARGDVAELLVAAGVTDRWGP